MFITRSTYKTKMGGGGEKEFDWIELTSACVVVWTGAPVVWRIAMIAITAILNNTNELIWIIFAYVV